MTQRQARQSFALICLINGGDVEGENIPSPTRSESCHAFLEKDMEVIAMDNEQLVIRIRAGIDTAQNMLQLWQQNQGFIYKIVNHYKGDAEEDDLLQEGYLGLSAAVEHYKQSEGVPFINYAAYWIRQRIVRYIRSNGTIRIPESIQGRIREYQKMIQRWQQTYGREPSDSEICGCLGISGRMLDGLRKAEEMGRIASLDVPVGEEGDSSLYDLLPGAFNEEEETLDRIQKKQLCVALWNMVDTLPGNQPQVLRARYQGRMTLKAISQENGVTLEAVRQQEQKGLRELRKPSKSRQLLPFLEDRLYSKALRGNSMGSFQRTWTSSTERAAIWEEEYRADLERLRAGM